MKEKSRFHDQDLKEKIYGKSSLDKNSNKYKLRRTKELNQAFWRKQCQTAHKDRNGEHMKLTIEQAIKCLSQTKEICRVAIAITHQVP